MAEKTEPDQHVPDEDDDQTTPGYKAPKEKSLDEILKTDEDDESLIKYKSTLLGQSAAGAAPIPFPDDPRKVIVKKLALIVEGRDDVELDLTGDLSAWNKKNPLIIKEGITYRMRITFIVQREIVTGLKYIQTVNRKGIKVDKDTHMVGSYGPQMEAHTYTTAPDEAVSGMLMRGTYTAKSLFTDDDKHEHLKWEWSFEIKKDWKD